ncbi:hypothetical protein Pmani_028986 [Petrolisthes manimaculis]|uniref:Uncharacterized protein n=1 Tax=Petrolisthes manimaculis TaxID=1843537 RepID=A0AAE1NZL9_9EUCA|nr:hypothetical protein Pmani_028986 [Petrolisthes manimaculis]
MEGQQDIHHVTHNSVIHGLGLMADSPIVSWKEEKGGGKEGRGGGKGGKWREGGESGGKEGRGGGKEEKWREGGESGGKEEKWREGGKVEERRRAEWRKGEGRWKV